MHKKELITIKIGSCKRKQKLKVKRKKKPNTEVKEYKLSFILDRFTTVI